MQLIESKESLKCSKNKRTSKSLTFLSNDINKANMDGALAQSVEQQTENLRVPSSILGGATIFSP